MNELRFLIKSDERTRYGAVSTYNGQRVRQLLLRGGLVLLPSDTCYSLAALAIDREVYKTINKILNRNELPISIAFPNFRTVESHIKLQGHTARLLEKFTPGPITVVCGGHSKLNEVARSADGTIGVRVPDSIIEREIAGYTRYPITTVAIRDHKQNVIQDFEEAIETVKKGIGRLGHQVQWAAIEGQQDFSQHSTVVRYDEQSKEVTLLREGEIPFVEIKSALEGLPIWDMK